MRPSGLTALAVFNFIFGGLGAITSLIGLATVDLTIKVLKEQAEVTGDPVPSAGLLYALILVSMVTAGLLITSGVGYLGLRRVTGRIVGNAYAAAALVGISLELGLMPYAFTINGLIGFVYPLITLFLLNVIFRKDFTR
jgi:hypothetical protein